MKTSGLFYGYVIVAAAFCTIFLSWGANRTFGVFFDPLLHEFGWSRANLSGVYTMCMFVNGIVNILLGRLTDRVGPRILLTGCSLAMGGGFLLCSQIQNILHFYIAFGLLTGIGMAGSWTPPMSIVARWFYKRRSLMSGILSAGSSLGVVVIPILTTCIMERIGWRYTFTFLGFLTLTILFVAAMFMKRDPGQMRTIPYGYPEYSTTSANMQQSGFTLKEALRTRSFWLMGMVGFCDFFLLNVVSIHIIPYALIQNIDPIHSASILSVAGAVSIVSRLGIGFLADRSGNRTGMLFCLSLSVTAFLVLLFIKDLNTFYGFAVFYGFGLLAASAIFSPFIADLFGLKCHGTIYSCTFFCSTLGGALGPVTIGYLFDITGGYFAGFILCLMVSLSAFIMFLFVRPPQKICSSPTGVK